MVLTAHDLLEEVSTIGTMGSTRDFLFAFDIKK
jgi:hypothetical protein